MPYGGHSGHGGHGGHGRCSADRGKRRVTSPITELTTPITVVTTPVTAITVQVTAITTQVTAVTEPNTADTAPARRADVGTPERGTAAGTAPQVPCERSGHAAGLERGWGLPAGASNRSGVSRRGGLLSPTHTRPSRRKILFQDPNGAKRSRFDYARSGEGLSAHNRSLYCCAQCGVTMITG